LMLGPPNVAAQTTPSCSSGGEGAISCSIESNPPFFTGCSVTCSTGYYACCDTHIISTCTCQH
jgi:hypothetical protein